MVYSTLGYALDCTGRGKEEFYRWPGLTLISLIIKGCIQPSKGSNNVNLIIF